MPFVKVTASFGELRATEGIYSETSTGVWDQISPANGYSLEYDSTNWFLLLGATSIAQDDASGDDTSPATGVWTGYTVEDYAAPGEITGTPASPSSPGELPSIGGGSSVVTSPGSITPQAPGSPTAPGAVNPVGPGVPDIPENYLSTAYAQSLTTGQKDQLAENWPEAIAPPSALPEFYDDFDRADTNPSATTDFLVTDPPVGNSYTFRRGSETATYVRLRIEGGELVSDQVDTAWYLLQTLDNDCYNMGAEFRFESTNSDPYDETGKVETLVVFIIKPDDTWLTEFLHIVIRESQWIVQHSYDGTGNFVTLASGNFSPRLIQSKFRTNTAEVEIYDTDRLRMWVNGFLIADVQSDRIRTAAGPYLAWESTASNAANGQLIYHDRIWANDPKVREVSINRSVQGYSPRLESLAKGTLTGSPKVSYNDRSNEGSATTRQGSLPVVLPYLLTEPVSNAGTSEESLHTVFGGQGQLAQPGDSVKFEYWGEFAANADSKSVNWDHSGLTDAVATRTTNGGFWKFEVILFQTDSNNYNYYAIFTDADGSEQFLGSANFGTSIVTQVDLKVTGTSAGDVTLSAVRATWQH